MRVNRKRIERRIVQQVIDDLLDVGFQLAVHDGEEFALKLCGNRKVILAAMFGTETDTLFAIAIGADGNPKYGGLVRFVYGNCPWEVIDDYTDNLAPILVRTLALVDAIEEQHL